MYALIDSEYVGSHVVTLKVTYDKEVLILIDGSVKAVDETSNTKLRLALAAKRLWQKTLKHLQPGVYKCCPTSVGRRKLYLSAGWRPAGANTWKLVYFHRVPAVPMGGLTRGYRHR